MRRPRILVTNDDGIMQPGIWALVRAVIEFTDVTVCAPITDQSGSGTSLTLNKSICITPFQPVIPGVAAYSVDGTPGDATILGITKVLNGKVDAVISGMNSGWNASADMIDSGTLGAVMHAVSRGVRGMAVSLARPSDSNSETVSRITAAIVKILLSGDYAGDTVYNLNFPVIEDETIKGVRSVTPAPRAFVEEVTGRELTEGGRAFWINSAQNPTNVLSSVPVDSDIWALRNGYACISCLSWNFEPKPSDNTLSKMVSVAEIGL